MTLNSRNKLLLTFCILMAVQTILLLLSGLVFAVSGNMKPFPESTSAPLAITAYLFAKNYHAGILNAFILTVFSTVTAFVLWRRFEKTIAPEIMYFAGFLLGMFFENFRLAIPIFNLWDGFFPVLAGIGKASFAGRLLALFCLLFTAFPVTESFVHDTDKNIGLGICVSVLFAALVPQNTQQVLPSVQITFMYDNLFHTIRVLLYLVALITIVSTNRFPRFYGLLFAYAGYLILTVSSNYALTVAGTLMLVCGTVGFLTKLHQFYLWK